MSYLTAKEENKQLNLEEIRLGRTKLRSKPLFFWFDLCGPCNLKCLHCPFQIHGRTSEQEVSEEVYQMVKEEIMPTAYVCNLGGTNFGEMTISKHFHRFLEDCKHYEVKVNLTTNGTRMHKDWFGDLMETLTVVGFSMEGIEEEFEAMRGFKWSHFLRNVELVCQGREDYGRDFKIEWRYCAHSDSIHQLPRMIRLAGSVGVDRIQVMPLVPYVNSQKFKMLYYHRSHANKCFAEARQAAEETGVEVNIPPDFDQSTFEIEPKTNGNGGLGHALSSIADFSSREIEMVNCYRPWQACSINELGEMRPCCVYWKTIGDLNTASFDSVWNGGKYRRLRGSVNHKPDKICHGCRLPSFDSEHNKSTSVLAKGIKELAQEAISHRRETIQFSGSMDSDLYSVQATDGTKS